MQFIFWLSAILVSAGAAFWVFRTDKLRAAPYPLVTALLRGLVIFSTLVVLLAPSFNISKNTIEKPVVLLLQDNSSSIAQAVGKDSLSYRKDMEALMTKLEGQYKVVKWGFGSEVVTDSIYDNRQQATDISAALEHAQEYFGMQDLGAVILATDGRYNRGINPLYQQLSLSASLYTVGIGDSTVQKDIRVAQAYANKVVALNSNFEVRADVVASLCKGYTNSIELKEGDHIVATAPVSVPGDKFDRTVSFTVKADKGGLHHYVLQAPVADGEQNTANNRKDLFVEVAESKKSILIASASPHPDVNAIKEALMGLPDYKITICTQDNFPTSLTSYNAIILHGLPSLKGNIAEQIKAARKPVWLIFSAQTDMAAVNSLAEFTHTTVAPSVAHEIQPLFNPAFNSFILPRQIGTVTDKMPPLSLNVSNVLMPPGTNSIFTQKTGVGNSQTPLWVLQSGNIPTAILAGEGLWRWRVYEFKNFGTHEVIDECIRQTVSFLANNELQKQFSVAMPKSVWSDQEPISLRAYLLNATGEQVNTPDVTLTLFDSAGQKQVLSMERSGTNYSLNIGIHSGGTYTYKAQTKYNSVDLSASGTFVVQSTPLEQMEQGADYPLLYGLAHKYNGYFTPASSMAVLYDSITHNAHIKPLIQTDIESEPFINKKWVFFVILVLAVAEWLLRKYWLAQ